MDLDHIVSQLISLNSLTNGRDKQFRLIQYLSRFIWTSLETDSSAVDRLKRLEEALSTSRKLLQLGRFIDSLNSARASVLLEDKTLNITLTLSKVSNSLFILSDNILWAGRIGVINIDRMGWFRTSFKLWLYSIFMNLVRDLYEIKKLLQPSMVRRVKQSVGKSVRSRIEVNSDEFRSESEPDPIVESKRVLRVLMKNKPVTIDLIKNLTDVWIPLNGLNHVTLSPRTIGLLGTISSACALVQVMYPSLRLNPS